MDEKFITITGYAHYYGKLPFRIGELAMMIKEPENEHDSEAIRIELPFIGKAAYVANNPHTCALGTSSAGRIYDTFSNACFVRIMFITDSKIIAKAEYGIEECVVISKMNINGVADILISDAFLSKEHQVL